MNLVHSRFWSIISMSYLLVLLAFALTMYLVVTQKLAAEALGIIIGVWLREGLGTVFALLTREQAQNIRPGTYPPTPAPPPPLSQPPPTFNNGSEGG